MIKLNLLSTLACGAVALAIALPMSAASQVAPPPANPAPPAKSPPPTPTAPAAPAQGQPDPGPLAPVPGGTDPSRLSPKAPQQRPMPRPTAPAVPAGPPAIKIEPSPLDLGELIPEIARTGTVTVTNLTDHPVKIIKIQPSCGCTTTSAPPEPLAPGASAKIDINLKATAKGGSKVAKTVSFQIDGHAPQVLTVEGFVREYISLVPDLMDAPSGEDPAPTTIRVSSKEDKPMKIMGAIPDIFEPLPEDAALTHDLKIDWKKWRAAGTPAKIAVRTDHPKVPQLNLMVRRSPMDARTAPAPTAASTQVPAIIMAVREGNIDRIKTTLASGGDVEQPESVTQRTALHFAAEKGNVEVVKALLDARANPNATDRTGRTPVALAAENRHPEALKMLLTAGGNIEVRDQVGATPILWAAGRGNAETVKILIDAGANINFVDKLGMSPLLWAANIGDADVVALLLEKGADITVRDTAGRETALFRAVRTGKPETVAILLKKGSDLSIKNNLGMSPFLVACASGNLEKIKMLVAAGADKTAKDMKGWGAIDYARNRLDKEKADVIKYLEPIVPASTATGPLPDKTPTASDSTKG